MHPLVTQLHLFRNYLLPSIFSPAHLFGSCWTEHDCHDHDHHHGEPTFPLRLICSAQHQPHRDPSPSPIHLTAQTWNPPYTFMLTVCQRLKGKCTKVIRYWGYRISGEIEVNFRAGWWLLYGISLEWVGRVGRWQDSMAFVIQFASVLQYNVRHRFQEHITLCTWNVWFNTSLELC